MKIAFVNQPWAMVLPPVQAGSLSIWTWEVARRLAIEHQVVVYEGCQSWRRQRVVRCEGVEYRLLYVGLDDLLLRIRKKFELRRIISSTPVAAWYYYWTYALQLALEIRKEKYDVVQMHQCAQFAPIIRALNPDVKIVLHMNAEWLTQFDARAVAQRLKSVDLILGCSEHISGLIRARFPAVVEKCETVPNGTDVDKFRPPADDDRYAGNGQRTKRLIFVGRISPEKGVHDLIEAFSYVAERIPDVVLDIVGPVWSIPANFLVDLSDDPTVLQLREFYVGEYRAHLNKRVSEAAAPRVRFVGEVPNDGLPSVYTNADVLINPSLSESFGITVTEAMASATPVVGTQVGGMKETIKDGETGFVVPPADPRALADAIVKLLADRELRRKMGQQGRARVVSLYGWAVVVNRLLGYYNRMLSRT